MSLDELAYVATANGLDFLAVTEHNTVSHQPYLRAVGTRHSILLIPGQEVTTDWGHANVFGETGWIDFHQNPEQWIRCAESCCALMSINHPIADHCAWQWALSTLPPLLEFWHSTWYQGREAKGLVDTGMWALWQRWSKRASIIGGGDFHSLDGPFLPGTPTTWVAAEELSIQGILDAVRRGRTAISLGLEHLSPQTCGVGDDGREHEPLLLPVGTSMMALECQHMQLVLPDGRRISIERQSQSFPQSLRHGIWRIEDDCGRVVAIAKTTGDCD